DPLADPRLNGRIREAVTSLERLAPPLHVVARVVVAEPLAGDDEAMDRPDDVTQRLAGACRERRRDAEVVLDADAQPQTGRIVEGAPETSGWPPIRSGTGASRAAAVKSRSGPAAMRSAWKRSDKKRSSADGRQPRCANRTRVSKSMPSPSSPISAKNSRGPAR